MSLSHTKRVRIIFLTTCLLLTIKNFGQCNLGTAAGTIAPTGGTVFTTSTGYSPGTYFSFPVLNGGSYAISTCGASIDTQITGWNTAGTSVLFYNDDNGALCSGTNASIDNFIPNFTNYANVQISQYNCLPGGSASINVLVRQNNNLVFTSANTAMCSGQSRTLTATPANVGASPGGYGNAGTFSGTGVSGTVFTAPTVTVPTNYTITYTFGYVSQTQVITVNPLPTVSVSNYNICSGNTITFTPSGASTYTYSNGSNIFTPTTNTSVSIVGTSSLGCLSSNTAISSITVNATPIISVNSGSICSGSSFTINASGASTYTISGGSSVVSPTTNTTYNVVGTNALGCISSNTAVSSVTVINRPTISVNNGSICAGSVFTIVPSGASTYTYSSGSATLAPSTSTVINVTGTSSVGCVSSNTALSSITVFALPSISVNSGSICIGQSFSMSITPGGAATYTISSGNSVVSPTVTSSYSIVGTSSAGCVSSTPAVSTVTVINLPTVTVNSGSICSGQSFTINPSGANTYTIQGGNAVVSPTTNSTYTVIGISNEGCVSGTFATASITVFSLPVLTANNGTICVGQSFTLNPSGASTYTIQGGNSVVSPSSTTTYSIIGTNTNGCVANPITRTVAVNPLPTVTAVSNKTTICSGESATLSASGASSYSWNSGANTASTIINPTINSTYTVIGTDANSCSKSFTLSQLVSECTALENLAMKGMTWSVYPNPSSGEFTIQAQNDMTIEMLNELGQLIKSLQLNQSSDYKITITDLPVGIYFVRAHAGNQVLVQKLIVSQ